MISNKIKMKILEVGSAYVLGIATLLIFQQLSPSIGNIPSNDPRGKLEQDNVLILVNEMRIAEGLVTLREMPEINASAAYIAQKIDSSNNCTHDFLREKRDAKIFPYDEVSENLACDVAGARYAIDGLLASPTHAKILKDPKYRFIGIGIAGDDLVLHVK